MTTHIVANTSIAAIRSQPSERSEMVSQMLFGETAEVLKDQGNWLNIRHLWDETTGWVDARQVTILIPSEALFFEKNHAHSLALSEAVMADDHFMPILLGSTLPGFDGIRLKIGEHNYTFSGQTIFNNSIQPTGELISRIAKKYLYAPQMSGGRGPFGIDPSGFTQIVYKMFGIRLFRSADSQVNQGRVVHFMEETQTGDLAFFDDERGRIDHVGLIISDTHILHVDGRVRADRIDHFGIFNEETNRYTHQLRVVKRILADEERAEKSFVSKKNGEEEALPQAVLFD